MSSAPPPSDTGDQSLGSSTDRRGRGPAGRTAVVGLVALAYHQALDLARRHGRRRVAAAGLLVLMLISPFPALTVAALAAYLVVTLKQPGLTVALLPFAAPFAYAPKDLFGPRVPVVELLLLIALGAGGLQLLVRWRRQAAAGTAAAATLDAWDEIKALAGAGFGPQALALAFIASFSLLTVADPGHLRESLREYRTVMIEPVIYFFLARYWLRNRELRGIAIAAFVAGAAVVAAIGIGQFVTGRSVVAAEGVRRAVGPYGHPNALALYLVRALPFALALLALSANPRRRRALLAACPLLALGLLLTFSRGAFVAVAIAVAILALLATRREARLALVGLLAAGGVLVLLLSGARFASLAGGGGSLGLRLLIWDATLAMIRDHPAFGVGLDQFLYQYAPRYIDPAAWEEKFTSHPHNLFLDFWIRLGIMGLAWIGWMLAALAASLARGWRATVDPSQRRLTIAAGLACIAAVAHGLVDNFFFLIDLAFVWWFLLALPRIGGAADQQTQATIAPGGAAVTPSGAIGRRGRKRRAGGTERREPVEPPAAEPEAPAPAAEPTEGW